ncbi:hypothetical protein, partial [Roseimarinus sediminis]|uniref:hypothetical protein n=1 Tax=Roseimarinus sediminis TaxID=1610899 RepID=UPI003D221468
MNNALLQSLITFFVATPIAVVLIRILFKKSIIARIAILWFISLIFLVTNTRISTAYSDVYPYIISMPVALIVIASLAYLAYQYTYLDGLQRCLSLYNFDAGGADCYCFTGIFG